MEAHHHKKEIFQWFNFLRLQVKQNLSWIFFCKSIYQKTFLKICTFLMKINHFAPPPPGKRRKNNTFLFSFSSLKSSVLTPLPNDAGRHASTNRRPGSPGHNHLVGRFLDHIHIPGTHSGPAHTHTSPTHTLGQNQIRPFPLPLNRVHFGCYKFFLSFSMAISWLWLKWSNDVIRDMQKVISQITIWNISSPSPFSVVSQ